MKRRKSSQEPLRVEPWNMSMRKWPAVIQWEVSEKIRLAYSLSEVTERSPRPRKWRLSVVSKMARSGKLGCINPSTALSSSEEKSGVGRGVAATLIGSSTLEAREGAREASDSDRDAGRGSAARAVRSSISSRLERGEGVQMSGWGLDTVSEPAPPRNRWVTDAVGGSTESDGNQSLPHSQQKAV